MKNQTDVVMSKKLSADTRLLTRIGLLAALSVVFWLVFCWAPAQGCAFWGWLA